MRFPRTRTSGRILLVSAASIAVISVYLLGTWTMLLPERQTPQAPRRIPPEGTRIALDTTTWATTMWNLPESAPTPWTLRMLGILNRRNERVVAIEPAPQAPIVYIAQGQTLDGITVVKIGSNEATIRLHDDERTLRNRP